MLPTRCPLPVFATLATVLALAGCAATAQAPTSIAPPAHPADADHATDFAAWKSAFAAQALQFVTEHGITHLAIKKRSKKGDFAGGPTTFKIEGILQLLEHCQVALVSPQTVSAQAKKHNIEPPASLNKYQHEAYKSACALLLSRR